MSSVSMCRLCLYSTSEYFEFAPGHDPDKILDKIQKFLYLQISDDDPFPRTICQKCMNRLQQFNEFYLEVLQNQEILQYSQPLVAENGGETQIFTITTDLGDGKGSSMPAPTAMLASVPSTATNLIQVTPGFNFKADSSGNYILTLQTSGVGSTVSSHENPSAMDLQQFISSNLMHTMPSTPSIVSATDSTIPEMNSPKSIQLRPTSMDASEVPRFTYDTLNHATAPYAIVSEVSEPFTTTTTVHTVKRVLEEEIRLPSIGKYTDRPKDITRSAPKLNIKQEPVNEISEMERELDNLENDEHGVVDSDNDRHGNECNADGDDDIDMNDVDVIDEIDIENERFNGFPKVIIKDAKLVIRGKQLVELMSKFYRLECDLCEDAKKRPEFMDLNDLYHHYVSAHTMKGYVICCGSKLIQPRAMALHMARHLQPDAFKCPQCDKMLTCPKILQYHIQNHLPEAQRPLACPQCPRRFSYSSALVAHSITHQPEEERDAHVCDECGKTFASAGRLTTHVNVAHMLHGQDFICHICAKQFACRSNLSYHLTTHQPKVRQVQCEKCDKWLKNKLCLRKHMLQHSSIRYTCTSCNYSALNRQCLRNHIRVHHTDGKPFACDVCGKSFKLKNTLLNHMVQHTGIRKFSCPFCARTFASSGNYYTHRKRMHPQELAAMQLKQEEEERKLRENPALALQ